MAYIGKQPRKAALTASDIEDGIITAAKIEDGAVVAAEIASNAVTTAKINADAVTGAKIADDAINSEHYTNGSIDTAHIAADQIVGSLIADNAIDSEHYTDGSIDTAHIAADQITNAKIADDQIDSEHYVDGSIDTAHIADVNVTQGKIADQAINEAKMQISNAPTNGYFLSAQSGNTGGLTWAEAGGDMKPAFFAFLNSDQNTSNAGNVKVAVNTEVIDTDSKYDNSTNYRFTPTVAGNYMVFMNLYIGSSSGALQHGTIKLYKNGSELSFSRTSHRSNSGEGVAVSWSGIVPLDSDDYIEMYGQGEGGGAASYFKGASDNQASSFGAFKIIE